MSGSGADLADPSLIRDFRGQVGRFVNLAAGALGGAGTEVDKVREWLLGEQSTLWKAQVRKREEAFAEARRRFQQAQSEVELAQRGRGGGKQSSDEERLEMRKAKRRLEEAEEKLALIRRWAQRLEQDGAPLVHQAKMHDLALRELGSHAMLRLDRLADAVQAYLDAPTGERLASPPSPDGGA